MSGEIDNEQAKRLLSQAEYRLYAASLHPLILNLNAETLGRKVDDARKLHQLWHARCESERQRAEQSPTKSARHRAATGHVAAKEKAQLFKETVERFETRLEQMGGERKTRITRKQPKN